MPISQLLKPKWKNADPAVRRKAVQTMDNDAENVLPQLALEDPDDGVRSAALERIDDLHVLCTAAEAGGEPAATAVRRLRERLKANAAVADSAMFSRLLGLIGDPELARDLAERAEDPQLRLEAVGHVSAANALLGIARDDPAASVRFAAAERLHDPAHLHLLEPHARKRDKRVARLVRERLEAHEAARQRQQARATVLAELAALVAEPQWPAAQATGIRLQQRWHALEEDAEAAQQQQFDHLWAEHQHQVEHYLQRQGEEKDLKARKQAILDQLERLLQETLEPSELRTQLTSLETDWQALTPLANAALEAEYTDQFQARCQRVADLIKGEQAESVRRQQAEQLQRRAEQLLAQQTPQAAAVNRLEADWHTLAARLDTPELNAIGQHIKAALQTLEARLKEQREHQRKQLQSKIDSAIEQLEQTLEAKQLQAAEAAFKQARDALDSTRELPRGDKDRFERRMRNALPALNELRDWRHWSTDHARENLIAETEALIGADLPVETLAEQVKAKREAWKKLGQLDHGAKALWERFDQACEKAFQPVAEHRQRLAEQRQQHLATRQQICAELESLLNETDWEAPNWRLIDKRVNQLRRSWREAGEVEHRDWRAVKRRFDQAIAGLEQHMDKERERNRRQRDSLIRKVKALAEESDIAAAVQQARDAQKAWQPTVTGRPRDEQRLWKEFKGAVDAVFERERNARQAADQTQQANLKRKHELCEELEAIANSDHATLLARQHEVDAIEQAFNTISDIPKRERAKIEKRLQNAQRKFEKGLQAALEHRQDTALERLAKKAYLCERLEAAIDAETAAALLPKAEQAWRQLAPEPEKDRQARLEARWQVAVAAARGEGCLPDEPTRQQALEIRHGLCLDMEILTQANTPARYQSQRMARQVELLAEILPAAGEQGDRSERVRNLRINYYLAGTVPDNEREVLIERFEKLVSPPALDLE